MTTDTAELVKRATLAFVGFSGLGKDIINEMISVIERLETEKITAWIERTNAPSILTDEQIDKMMEIQGRVSLEDLELMEIVAKARECAAYKLGQEVMRVKAVNKCFNGGSLTLRNSIRALPIEGSDR
jgi:hypothetical protein